MYQGEKKEMCTLYIVEEMCDHSAPSAGQLHYTFKFHEPCL